MTGLLWMCTWAMDVATLFLTLASVMTSAWEGLFDEERARLSSWWEQEERLFSLKEWKEKWLEKKSITLQPEANSGLRGSKAGKTSLNLLSMLMTGPLIDLCWHFVTNSSDKWCRVLGIFGLNSNKEQRMWLFGRVWTLSCNLPLNFWRWR